MLLAAALAFAGAVVAGYLAADQLGMLRVWDPLFGGASTEAVLHSRLSRALPVPDALLGAAAYLFECALAIWLAVAERRGQGRPWSRTVYGAIVVGMAVAGAGLVAIQAFYVRAFCSFCLVSALVSWAILPLAYSTFAPGFRATLVRIVEASSRTTRRRRTV